MTSRMHHIVLSVLVVTLAACGEELADPEEPAVELSAVAETVPSAVPSRTGLGMIESRLYPPALVLDHQAAIQLTPEQRAAILLEIETTQAELVAMDADLRRSLEVLDAQLGESAVDEALAMADVETVIGHEHRIKTSHFRMLIRVRNQLTVEQRTLLDTMR